MLKKRLLSFLEYLLAVTGTISLFTATAIAAWLLFPVDDPKLATAWFLTPYQKVYLPSLAIGSTVVFIYMLRRQYREAVYLNVWLIAASCLCTIATMSHLVAYYWSPIILAPAVLYQIWLWAFVSNEQLGRAEKTLIGPANQAGESAKEEIRFPAEKARASFNTVVGMSEVKARLHDAAIEVTGRPTRGQSPRNGILLYGEPGNGKTFIAEALAGELNLPIIKASFGDVVSKWIGETSESVRQLFDDAARQAPCVLFIDEIDSLIRDRNASMGGGNSEEAKTTNILLTGLVNIRSQGVVVVAATNFLDKLDGAAIREGRFDFKVEIPSPDKAARTHLIKSTMFSYKGKQLSETALAQATKRWDGFSVVRIRSIVDEACRSAVKERKTWLEYTDLQAALRTTQGKQGDKIPESTPLLDEVRMDGEQSSKLQGIAHRMRCIEEIEAMGGTVPTGILFWGPPGTGKTLTVRSLAKTTGWVLKSVNGGDLVADIKKVDEIAEFAKNNRPCIVFIDEADDVLGHRGMGGGHAGMVTNKLLTAIDGAKGKTPDVVWVAATNHPNNIDEAALRGGRFTEKIEFAPPNATTAARMAQDWINKSSAKFDAEVDGVSIAERLEGESPANINAILQQAVNLMIERKLRLGFASKVTLDDVSEARLIVSGQ